MAVSIFIYFVISSARNRSPTAEQKEKLTISFVGFAILKWTSLSGSQSFLSRGPLDCDTKRPCLLQCNFKSTGLENAFRPTLVAPTEHYVTSRGTKAKVENPCSKPCP